MASGVADPSLDWAAIEQSAIQGVSYADIAKSLTTTDEDYQALRNAIKQRAFRDRWNVPRAVKAAAAAKAVKAGRTVTGITEASRETSKDLASDQIGRFRAEIPVLLAEKIRESLVTVTENGLPDIRGWKDMATAVQIGYKVAGLDSKSPGVQVNIAVGGASKLSSCGGVLGIQVQVGESGAE